jgi:hypothetical protein
MGSGTKGWVMLNNVPVWFEIWRQFNGFPASLYEQPEDAMMDSKIENSKYEEEEVNEK